MAKSFSGDRGYREPGNPDEGFIQTLSRDIRAKGNIRIDIADDCGAKTKIPELVEALKAGKPYHEIFLVSTSGVLLHPEGDRFSDNVNYVWMGSKSGEHVILVVNIKNGVVKFVESSG